MKDLLNAILFLFYEPNFDDPLNGSASVSENGLTMEQTIRKSLYGGVVNDVTYDPNAAWIQWAEENGIHPSIKECSEVGTIGKWKSLLGNIPQSGCELHT